MLFRAVTALLLLVMCAPGRALDCTDKDLALLKQRVICNHSNTPANCASLTSLGALGGVVMLRKLSKTNPKAEAYSDFFRELDYIHDNMASSYRKALEVFFELEKKSGQKLSDDKFELKWQDYQKYKAVMDADPRLKDNLFLEKFRQQGRGSANEIFQRDFEYAEERVKSSFESKKIQFNFEEILDAAAPSMEYSEYTAKKIFREVATENGVSLPSEYKSMAHISEALEANSSALERERAKAIESFEKTTAEPTPETGGTDYLSAGMMGVSAIDFATKNFAVSQCAKTWNIPLSLTEIKSLAEAMTIRGGAKNAKDCSSVEFMPEIGDLIQHPSTAVRSFLCNVESNLANFQDHNSSDEALDQIQNNPNCEKSWAMTTSKGDVMVYLNSANEWDYSRFKSSNPDLQRYLQDKLLSPMNSLATRSQRLSPDQACDPSFTGSLDKAYCDLSKQMFSYGQMAGVHKAMCKMKTPRRPSPFDEALPGTR